MKKFTVITPIADLRKEPIPHRGGYEKDPLQESQLLFGERLICHEERQGWLFIEAIEQRKCSLSGQWSGYPGWIQRENAVQVEHFEATDLVIQSPWATVYKEPTIQSQVLFNLSFGTRLASIQTTFQWWIVKLPDGQRGAIQKKDVMDPKNSISLLDLGKKFLGAPYLWGGRSAYLSSQKIPLTSMDCSGLINLLYRVKGINIPRDAHDQYLVSKKVEFSDLSPGDLIFSTSPAKPDRIDHVMLYAGGDLLLESTMKTSSIRIVTLEEKFGIPMSDVSNVYFGKIEKR